MKKSAWTNRGWSVIALAVVFACGGCDRRSGEAIVRGKEHIPVAEVVPSQSAIPSGAPVTDDTTSADEPTPGEAIVTEEEEAAASGPDVRGTSKDPRALDHEQWIVNVEMVRDLRRLDVRVDQPRWNALHIGDRVKVTYKIGKYTGTVWDSRIE